MTFGDLVDLASRMMEAAGILVMVGGSVVVALTSFHARHEGGMPAVYRSFRRRLGGAILLGLEFLVAGDIIRTVSEIPTLEKVFILAIIVLIRTFLSFTLEVELEGRWPWKRAGDPHGAAPRPSPNQGMD